MVLVLSASRGPVSLLAESLTPSVEGAHRSRGAISFGTCMQDAHGCIFSHVSEFGMCPMI